MKVQKNKILIVCYSFPPHPGIGGRRWAKFSKMLSLQGYEPLVIGAKNYSNNVSFWTDDSKDIKTKTYKFKFQKILKNPKSVFEKLFRKVILLFINRTKYNPHIITSLPNKKIWQEVKDIIVSQQINKVIVSGDPYLFYYCSLIKKEVCFDLIIDYRDLWNDHSFYNRYVKLQPRQKEYFEYVENYAVNNCNKIIFVDEHLESVIKKRMKVNTITTHVLHNGFDKDDFISIGNKENTASVINIFFAGSISSDLNDLLKAFVIAFKKLSEQNFRVYQQFNVSIFGEMDQALVKELTEFKLQRLKIESNTLEIKGYYEQLQNSDVGLVILSDEYKNSFITKFADYLFYNKFIVSLGSKGDFVDYIEKQNIGMGFEDESVFFENLLQKVKNNRKLPEVEKNKFDLNHITRKLVNEVIIN